MKDHDANRHPGPWRVMRIDSEFTGILIAAGFIAMAIVSMPLATAFVLGSLVFGGLVALLLRVTPKRYLRMLLITVTVVVAAVFWWAGRRPQRPQAVSPKAFHIETESAGFILHKPGFWVDCWFDKAANLDRCKLTDEKGARLFEDVFLTCRGQTIPEDELILNEQRTGNPWNQSPDNRANLSIVFLEDHRILLPQSRYAEAKQVYCFA